MKSQHWFAWGAVLAFCSVVLAGLLVIGIVLWRCLAEEVGIDQIVPAEASSSEHESGGTFGSFHVYARSHVTREGLDAFARRNGYVFTPVAQCKTGWAAGYATHLFDDLAGSKQGQGGFLHCLAQDRTKRLGNGGWEGYLEFFYDVERQILYSLYWD